MQSKEQIRMKKNEKSPWKTCNTKYKKYMHNGNSKPRRQRKEDIPPLLVQINSLPLPLPFLLLGLP